MKISSRERVRLALDHLETDRIPIAMVCSGVREPARKKLDAYLKRHRGVTSKEFFTPLIDLVSISPDYIGPQLADDEDIWSVRRRPVSHGAGSYSEIYHYPLAQVRDLSELDACRWPSSEWWDCGSLPDKIRHIREREELAIYVGNGNIFESSWYMRGFEQMFLDLALNPELANEIMRRVTDYYVDYFSRVLHVIADDVDLVFTADDIGGQQGLLMSLEMWRHKLQPHHVRLNKVIHEFGVKVIYHSDGDVSAAVGGLIDMGVDVLQALQFEAWKMTPTELKTKFGDHLCFQGGVSVQKTLPFGSVDEVRSEVRELIQVLGRGGGYILGPSHAIQEGTPPENIVAMFDEAAVCPMGSAIP